MRDRVARLAAGGKGLAQVIAAHPTAEFDSKMAGGFVKPDIEVEMIYRSLEGGSPPAR